VPPVLRPLAGRYLSGVQPTCGGEPIERRIDACVCYVRDLGEEALFTLRYGAHSLSCPVYRRSGDLADAINDQAFRLAHEKVPQ
jgi:hypothetical protein